ncbi:MAG: hypothetical protein INQ03_07565 [Candidatus Heimdallarchaeota archaeon]|nr:hypothetical protein [Candidatus Heimdallarchaeota archaeon]
MDDLKEITEIMQSLGFTKYEIQVLIKLYQNGPSKADELKDKSNPLSRVYDALDLLHRKKFVKLTQGRPRIYEAIRPQEAINQLINEEKLRQSEHITSYSTTANKLLKFAQDLYYEKHTEISPDDLMTQYPTLIEAEEKTKLLIRSAVSSIDIFTNVFHWFDEVKDELADSIKRGCEVRVLLQGENQKETISQLEKMGAQVKQLHQIRMLSRGTIVDRQSIIFIIWVEESKTNRKIFRPQYSNNLGIVEVFNLAIENLWN